VVLETDVASVGEEEDAILDLDGSSRHFHHIQIFFPPPVIVMCQSSRLLAQVVVEKMKRKNKIIVTTIQIILFSQKTDIFAELIPNNRLENEPSSRTMSFMLGADTMV
jgi:hypothetical protein